jgi:hypothetical protein
MARRCCTGGGTPRRLARRLSAAAATLLPGAVLVLLPKCPLCLAAWLTVLTGVGVSAATAAHLRGISMVFCIAAVAIGVAQTLLRPKHPAAPHRIASLLANRHTVKRGNADWS